MIRTKQYFGLCFSDKDFGSILVFWCFIKVNVPNLLNPPDVLLLVFLCDLNVSSSWFQLMGGDLPQDFFVNREKHLQSTLLDVVIPTELQKIVTKGQTIANGSVVLCILQHDVLISISSHKHTHAGNFS